MKGKDPVETLLKSLLNLRDPVETRLKPLLNCQVRRRGSGRGEKTATMQPKDWAKRKFKFDLKGNVFVFADGQQPVEEFSLQSHYEEPGERALQKSNQRERNERQFGRC